jgi:hypothetical protein
VHLYKVLAYYKQKKQVCITALQAMKNRLMNSAFYRLFCPFCAYLLRVIFFKSNFHTTVVGAIIMLSLRLSAKSEFYSGFSAATLIDVLLIVMFL